MKPTTFPVYFRRQDIIGDAAAARAYVRRIERVLILEQRGGEVGDKIEERHDMRGTIRCNFNIMEMLDAVGKMRHINDWAFAMDLRCRSRFPAFPSCPCI